MTDPALPSLAQASQPFDSPDGLFCSFSNSILIWPNSKNIARRSCDRGDHALYDLEGAIVAAVTAPLNKELQLTLRLA